MQTLEIRQPVRAVVHRTKGHTSGPITRLVSPSGLGELIKPFVFLDLAGEIAIFAEGPETIDFLAEGATRFVVGSARKHPHPLVLGDYSVHTSAEALRRVEAEIRRIGARLLADGTLGR